MIRKITDHFYSFCSRSDRMLDPKTSSISAISDNPAPRIKTINGSNPPSWSNLCQLASGNLNVSSVRMLDQLLAKFFPEPSNEVSGFPVRMGVLGSSTVQHLFPALRVGGLRRGLHIKVQDAPYGQIVQPLLDPDSSLRKFNPNAILLNFDAIHICSEFHTGLALDEVNARYGNLWEHIEQIWKQAKEVCKGPVLQHVPLPIITHALGENEHQLPGSPAHVLARFSFDLRARASQSGIHLVSTDVRAARDGIAHWHDPALWHHAKQEISLRAAPIYGDLVSRVLAAAQGLSAKCLVLDLDNTLWGGVIGDDGMQSIRIGHGSAEGEAFLGVQRYALALRRRGIILAVCSKNDETIAKEPFEKHPEMLLRLTDISCFVANWNNKADNIRQIADDLNIGMESIVFVDDNPAERDQVRRELPKVRVPEIPDDPALIPNFLADTGYFESVGITSEDFRRSDLYLANQHRSHARTAFSDMDAYLKNLSMQLHWGKFNDLHRSRIVQLINKTNQFNLTTLRHGEVTIEQIQQDPNTMGLYFRLDDRFGDNGLIAVVILANNDSPLTQSPLNPGDVAIDTWLMSCRVLGRRVEEAVFSIIQTQAAQIGGKRLIGKFTPTEKNAMVADLYSRLGFTMAYEDAQQNTYWYHPLKKSSLPIQHPLMVIHNDNTNENTHERTRN